MTIQEMKENVLTLMPDYYSYNNGNVNVNSSYAKIAGSVGLELRT
jgi:hypothetical protein